MLFFGSLLQRQPVIHTISQETFVCLVTGWVCGHKVCHKVIAVRCNGGLRSLKDKVGVRESRESREVFF